MKPYSPKRKGSTAGSVSCTSNCPTRQRAIRRDKKAARRETKAERENRWIKEAEDAAESQMEERGIGMEGSSWLPCEP